MRDHQESRIESLPEFRIVGRGAILSRSRDAELGLTMKSNQRRRQEIDARRLIATGDTTP